MSEPVTVYVDFKAPEAWLALDGVRALERELGLEFTWLPLVCATVVPSWIAPEPPPPGTPETTGQRHRRVRAEYAAMDLRRTARWRGLALSLPAVLPDSSLASAGLLFARAQGRAVQDGYVDQVFAGAFAGSLELASPAALEEALVKAGGRPRGFRGFLDGAGRRALASLQRETEELGLFSAPAIVVGDDVYLGRQHLPRIRWLLKGRRGPAPG